MLKNGYQIIDFPLPPEVKGFVQNEDWQKVDAVFLHLNSPGGDIFNLIHNLTPIKRIEQMISVRDAQDEWQEDGLWHDDGSRTIAYSLSLTTNSHELIGGKLGLRKKGEDSHIEINTPSFGKAIVFLTGIHGFEHKIHKVLSGKRIILVGWCS